MMRRVILVIPAAVCFRRLPAFWQLSVSAHFPGRPAAAGPAEGHHRDLAVVEQVFADWTDGPMAHLPSVIGAVNSQG
jgi:hypothetical protein